MRRRFRDPAFCRQVCSAYGYRCAVSGLCLIDAKGRSELVDAHIRPVAQGRPCSVRNSLALFGTVHWVFDRGLIWMAPNYSTLRSSRMPLYAGFLVGDALRLPRDDGDHPHEAFLRYHREYVFLRY